MSPPPPVILVATLANVAAACTAAAAGSASSDARTALHPGNSPHSSGDHPWFAWAAVEPDTKIWSP